MSMPWTSEHQAVALQLVVEIDRGMNIASRELKAARFADARDSLAVAMAVAGIILDAYHEEEREIEREWRRDHHA